MFKFVKNCIDLEIEFKRNVYWMKFKRENQKCRKNFLLKNFCKTFSIFQILIMRFNMQGKNKREREGERGRREFI